MTTETVPTAHDLLEVQRVGKRFGGLLALEGVTFKMREGETLGIIGPNGAGKTTLFNVITGAYRPDSGAVVYRGEDISGLPSRVVATKGLVRTFQLTAVFREMTVIENIALACHLRGVPTFWGELVNSRRARRETQDAWQTAHEIALLVGLDRLQNEPAGRLPYGYRKALSIAIALATDPQLLLLDEPVSGMNQIEIENILGIIRGLRDRGISVVIVEHNMHVVMGLCDRIVGLNFGRKIAEGTPEQVRSSKEVIEAYLGVEENPAGVSRQPSSGDTERATAEGSCGSK